MLWKKRYQQKSEEELKERWNGLHLEKGDLSAMIIAALITLLPVVLLVGGAFSLVLWILFLR